MTRQRKNGLPQRRTAVEGVEICSWPAGDGLYDLAYSIVGGLESGVRSPILVAMVLVLVWPILCHAAEPTFSEAIGLLSQERSYGESGAALVKRYAPSASIYL